MARGEVVERTPKTLKELAEAFAGAALTRPGVDGAIVILLRKDGDEFAGASRAPTIPFDGVFGAAVKALVSLRDNALEQMREMTKNG